MYACAILTRAYRTLRDPISPERQLRELRRRVLDALRVLKHDGKVNSIMVGYLKVSSYTPAIVAYVEYEVDKRPVSVYIRHDANYSELGLGFRGRRVKTCELPYSIRLFRRMFVRILSDDMGEFGSQSLLTYMWQRGAPDVHLWGTNLSNQLARMALRCSVSRVTAMRHRRLQPSEFE
jgi:hypothetical protein